MTTYVVAMPSAGLGGAGPILAVRAGSYALKISRVEYAIISIQSNGFNSNGAPFNGRLTPVLSRYQGGSMSGGTSITPAALRQGELAASATARYGSVSFSGGTRVDLDLAGCISASGSLSQPGTIAGSTSSYTFPYDVVISPGSCFFVTNIFLVISVTSVLSMATVFFEELRLSWPT